MNRFERHDHFNFGKYTISCDKFYNSYIQEYSYFISIWDNDVLKDYYIDFKNEQDCIKHFEKMAFNSTCYPMDVLNEIKDTIKSN